MTAFSLHHVVGEPAVPPRDGERSPAILLLHGFRSHEQDLLALGERIDERLLVICARAPLTVAPSQYAWYPVEFTRDGYITDDDEARKSRALVLRFVDEVLRAYPIDHARFFIGGFSQGCVMSAAVALAAPTRFAGLIGMSGRFLPALAPDDHPYGVENLNALVTHGTGDTVIPVDHGYELRDRLVRLGARVRFYEDPAEHTVTQGALQTVQVWIKEFLSV